MSNNVQWYKAQVVIGGIPYPVPEGGANLAWDKNFQVPAIAGNFAQMNYIEGVQMPSMDVQHKMVDGDVRNILNPTLLNQVFMTRSNDFSDDIAAFQGAFFDGYSGWDGLWFKGQAWSLSCSKASGVSFSSSFLCFKPPAEDPPTSITTPPTTYDIFTGAPIHFQGCSFTLNGSPLEGVNSFDVTFSNNLTADMSMVGTAPQDVFPVDVNTGMPSGTARLMFQANAVQHLANGDELAVRINQGGVDCTFTMHVAIPSDVNSRSIGASRQMRPYTCRLLGADNSLSGRIITIS